MGFNLYNKTKKSALLRYFDTCFMHNIEAVYNIRWHDSLSMYCIDKEIMSSSIRNYSYIVNETCVKITEEGKLLGLIVTNMFFIIILYW